MNTLQRFLTRRKTTISELLVFIENKRRSQVIAVRVFIVIIKSRHVLNLNNAFYIIEFSRNLISFSRLIPKGCNLFFLKIL